MQNATAQDSNAVMVPSIPTHGVSNKTGYPVVIYFISSIILMGALVLSFIALIKVGDIEDDVGELQQKPLQHTVTLLKHAQQWDVVPSFHSLNDPTYFYLLDGVPTELTDENIRSMNQGTVDNADTVFMFATVDNVDSSVIEIDKEDLYNFKTI
jgi:hypothetical protein